MNHYVLGIDGGGTKTAAVIVDEGGRLHGVGLAGPSNYDDVGVEAARAEIERAVAAARRMAGRATRRFDAAFLGIAGVVSPKDHAIVRAMAAVLDLAPPERVGADHDCRIALAGGLTGRPGIVQIAGTGSSTFGMNAAGVGWRAGGWGHIISDEGSGYWLGLQAMKAAVRAFDGRIPPTQLVDLVQRQLGIEIMNDIMHRLYVVGMSRAEVAALAPLVLGAAREGDAAALGLVARGMRAIADCAAAVARRIGMADGPCELALVGGLFQAGEIVLAPLRAALADRLPGCQISLAELPPVLGACLLGLQQIEIAIEPPIVQALREGARRVAQAAQAHGGA